MDIYEEYIEGLIQMAEDALYDDKYDEARKWLECGLHEEPGYPRLHIKLGELYHYHIKNCEKAEFQYQLAIKFNPKEQEFYENLVQLYYEENKYQGIRIWLNKAIPYENINRVFIYGNLGQVAEAETNYNMAITFYKKARLASLNNYVTDELKGHIKRNKYKRLKRLLGKAKHNAEAQASTNTNN
ncbi:tetratricopeptide repeat protein [Roseivirga misakiensis]|uniref:Uncharacterized protein n=1 Tax=Roseivirga misakiensis TaxID=1563681 RepID=A0A1E5SXZ2_9BACT|nr:hypothetical protein [Roseivirga misakiensis]OEK03991.1 hypothetical protein BFP71_10865 [Roseivirga misakiensis]